MSAATNIVVCDAVVCDAASSLPMLAAQINAKVEAAVTHANAATLNALDVGRLLIAAKKQVVHGQWDSWLQANCKVAPRTARAYMRLANKLSTLPLISATVAEMPLRDAMRAIATPPQGPARPRRWPATTKDDRERAVVALRHSAKGMARIAREIEDNFVYGPKLASLRSKLTAAIEAVDKLAAGEVVTDSAKCAIAQIGGDHA